MSTKFTPGEIIDLIIDHLHGDQDSLQACSITCKQWLPSSRYHLFSRVLLSPFNVDKFRKLLETAGYDIASIPFHLTLSEFNGYICWHEGIDIAIANEDLRSVFNLIREVKFLRVVRSEGLESEILSKLTGVRELEMVDMSVSGMDDAIRLVQEIPRLQMLSMENISWHSSVINMQWAQRPSFALRTMKLRGAAFTNMTEWLLRLNPMPAVHTLHCDSYDPMTSLSRNVLLQSVGHTVHSLHLHLGGCPMPDQVTDLIKISTCINLRAFYLMDMPTSMLHSRRLVDILSQIPSHELQELILQFYTPNIGSSWVNFFDQAGIARLLAGPKFIKLRALRVDCRLLVGNISGPYEIAERRIDLDAERSISKGAFSDLHRRGILQFIHTDA